MPDTLDNNLNLTILTKFILEKVKDFEKDVGSFIEKVNLIIDAKHNQFFLSLKNKYNSSQIKDTDVVRLINDAKQLITRCNKNCFILVYISRSVYCWWKKIFWVSRNLDYKEFIVDISFITINSSNVKILNRILKIAILR